MFLHSLKKQPILLKRYIDDIFVIWPANKDLNSNFHEKIQFTTTKSDSSVNFLDLTIFKGNDFQTTGILDIKMYEKAQNLYHYLEFSSFHPGTTFKLIITGECIRYLRTNTIQENYELQVELLTTQQIDQNNRLWEKIQIHRSKPETHNYSQNHIFARIHIIKTNN